MEKAHKTKISQKFQALLKGKKLVLLNIPDKYLYMQTELIEVLKAKVAKVLRL